ncbi:UDP-glycosyltransferase 83A1-like [Euphorbia lathyris]|uniref:UDP-glycosyltransferase 83A1-like n=1 Tax=Euphorbia lathyris TaxID=212925 RepID=UPI00331384E7
MVRKGHVLVIPYPAQGHVKPLMHLSLRLSFLDFKVTFVNTEFNHKRVITSANHPIDSSVSLVSISDGLGFEDDRTDIAKLCESILNTMPEKLEELIRDINIKGLKKGDEDGVISCVVADGYMGWVRNVADKLGIKVAVAWPSSAAMFSLLQKVPQLIDQGYIDHQGFTTNKQILELSPRIPPFDTQNFPWNSFGDSNSQKKTMFKYLKKTLEDSLQTEWILCNSAFLLEHGSFSLSPTLSPIGPLMTPISPNQNSAAQFWKEDPTCLKWLDQQPHQSVIYVAFGSFTIFDQTQFEQLALALQLTNKPFLWVVRPEITQNQKYPDGFEPKNGRIVGWVPQHKVLSHPSIACFVSHCGWNSTIEGISNGVPFLCWPYFGDQFLNKGYICDSWRVGLGLEKDEMGIIRKEELKGEIEQLIGDKSIKERCLKVMKIMRNNVEEGGDSFTNFSKFIKWLEG